MGEVGQVICSNPRCGLVFIPKMGWETQQCYCTQKCQLRWGSECYRVRHPDKVKDSHSRSYMKHRTSTLETTTQWRRAHPEVNRASVKSRRARKRGCADGLTDSQWVLLKGLYQFRCAYCHKRKPLTQDHVIPLSKGGSHTIENVVPACRSCNSRKGAKLL